MKINEVLAHVNALKPNFYETTMMLSWLNKLEESIVNDVFKPRRDCPVEDFTPYEESDIQEELLVPSPYDDIYELYLMAQVDYYNGETTKYNNSVEQYNARYNEFANYWYAHHRDAQKHDFRIV